MCVCSTVRLQQPENRGRQVPFRRGLMRAWLVLSAVYAAAVIAVSVGAIHEAMQPKIVHGPWEDYPSTCRDVEPSNPFSKFACPPDAPLMETPGPIHVGLVIGRWGAWAVVPPLLILLLGYAVAWVVRGFRPLTPGPSS